MASKCDDDEYVANLLKQDAKNAAKTYALVGIDAFNPKRQKFGAPKPNTNFLRHIIRQTDSHNAALLAKEAEESNARLKAMKQEKQRDVQRRVDDRRKKAEGRLFSGPNDEDACERSSTKRRDRERDEDRLDNRLRSRERGCGSEKASRKHRDKSKDVERYKRQHEHKEEDRSARKRRHRYHSDDDDDDDDDNSSSHKRRSKHRNHRRHILNSQSRSRSRLPSRSHSHHSGHYEKSHRHRDRSRSPRRARADSDSKPRSSDNSQDSRKPKRRPASPTTESDPLETLVGPLPPFVQPVVRARGRGAYKASTMGMNSRFAVEYDPGADVRLESDAEDDWGDALEALRDRQRWKQQGADRLKAAGFTDEQVKKWEKGDSQNEDDVVWTKRGQAREWDRGKVVDEDGNIELKADFGQVRKTLQ